MVPTLESKNVILIMDPRGVIVSGGKDVVDRQIAYSKQLSHNTEKNLLKLLVLTSGTEESKNLSTEQNNFSLIQISAPTFNSFYFSRKAKEALRMRGFNPTLLVAGDPWEGFWSAFFLNKWLGKNIPIQVQVHGDIADEKWKTLSWRNNLRSKLATLSLKRATRIRATTEYQADNLVKRYELSAEIIDVIPVPIFFDEPKGISTNSGDRPRTLGFVGRIHADRGTKEFLKIVELLERAKTDFVVHVIGDGPQLNEFTVQLEKILSKERVKIHGQVSRIQLDKLWGEVGILVSVAPVESYGRAMREAIAHGVPVWALGSSGVEALIDDVPNGWVGKIDFNNTSAQMKQAFEKLLGIHIDVKYRDEMYKKDQENIGSLVRVWGKMSAMK